MSTALPSDPLPMPTTPVKADMTEPTPDYTTPAPRYTKSAVPDPLPATGSSIDTNDIMMLSSKSPHPVYPRGDIFHDIRNHLRCHTIFNINIETLLSQFLTMKTDLENANIALAASDRKLGYERNAKESYMRQAETLKITLEDCQSDLRDARSELAATQTKLSLSVTQLADLGKRLEKAKRDLRVMTHERDQVMIDLADKQRDLDFNMSRVADLKLSLEVAIKTENDANERNTRITELLLEMERKMVVTERDRDSVKAKIRELEDERNELRDALKNKGGEDLINELRILLGQSEVQVLVLKEQLVYETNRVTDRDAQIEQQVNEIKNLNEGTNALWKHIQEYNNIVNKLNHYPCQKKFPRAWRRKNLDGPGQPGFFSTGFRLMSEESSADVESLTVAADTADESLDTEQKSPTLDAKASDETPSAPEAN